MVNSFGINVDVIKYFCCISIITQPLKCCQHYMESFENQMWIICSEITTTAFWHRKTTFSIPNCPQEAEEPLGQCLGPGLAARKRGHPDPGIFLPQDERRRNILLVCSTRAKQLRGHTFQPLGIFHFFPIAPGIPWGTLLLPELSALVFPLMCCVCPNKNTRENLHLQPIVCRDYKGVHNTSGQTQRELIAQPLW